MLLLFAKVAAIVVGCLQLGGGVPCDKSINSLPKPVPGPTAKADRNERLAASFPDLVFADTAFLASLLDSCFFLFRMAPKSKS